jgi:hypothetical protein
MNNLSKIIFLLFFFSNNTNGQDDISNNKKYWYYKSRLNNDFIKVGLGSGESIPCQIRGANNLTHTFYGAPNTLMDWGDASSYLGYYIGTLAMEYYLLQQNNQNTAKVSHELFCALNAVNRIDYVGETFFGGTPLLNGYFVRDDVPIDFIKNNYQHFNYYDNGANGTSGNNLGKGFNSKFQYGADTANSSRISWERWKWGNPPDDLPHDFMTTQDPHGPIPEMSQDQAYAIILGLAFVKKFVPTSVTDNNIIFPYSTSGNKSLSNEADQITKRIIGFIKNSTDSNGNRCSPISWIIRNPITCRPVGWNKSNFAGLGFGADATFFSYAIAESGCVINSNSWGTIQFQSLGWYPKVCNTSSTSYHDFFSTTRGVNTWDIISNSLIPGNGDNKLHVANLSAVCNCVYGTMADKVIDELVSWMQQIPLLGWLGAVIGWVYKIVSSIIHTLIPGYYLNNTSSAININSYSTLPNIDIDHAPMARKVLHGGHYQHNPDYNFKYLLNVMPCDNIFFLDGSWPYYNQIEWSGTDRIEHSRQRASPKGDDTPTNGEYPALDYLFYHNLWYVSELQNGNNPQIMDLSDTYINLQGGTSNQNEYKGFETITTESTVFSPQGTDINLRAGKTVSFLPGTALTASPSGGLVHAYIQKSNCATD